MGMPGLPELLIIGGVVVLLFGAKKLPALGGAIGESLRNFKKGLGDKDQKNLPDAENESKPSES